MKVELDGYTSWLGDCKIDSDILYIEYNVDSLVWAAYQAEKARLTMELV